HGPKLATRPRHTPPVSLRARTPPSSPPPPSTEALRATVRFRSMTDGFDLTRDGEVARLTLTRPEKMNAITYGMWAAIPDVVAEVEADPALKALVIAGAGKHFSAGADISEFGELRTTADGAA